MNTRFAPASLWILFGAMIGAMLVSLCVGAASLSLEQIFSILANKAHLQIGSFNAAYTSSESALLWDIRLPRLLLGVLVGGGLAVAGAALQGLFRNPLADPALIGVSGGAAVAAAACFVLGGALFKQVNSAFTLMVVPLVSFLGGFGLVQVIWRISQREGRTQVHTMLLAGIALNALCGAGIGVLTFMASDAQLRSITFWNLGSLGGATWPIVGILSLFVLIPVGWLLKKSRALNALLLGEAEAGHLGVSVEQLKQRIILYTALIVGAAVSFVGIIGFIGLVTPHLIRLWKGPDYRALFPHTFLLGAFLLILSDLGARLIVVPAELPIGVMTALLGAPFFIWMLLRERESL